MHSLFPGKRAAEVICILPVTRDKCAVNAHYADIVVTELRQHHVENRSGDIHKHYSGSVLGVNIVYRSTYGNHRFISLFFGDAVGVK